MADPSHNAGQIIRLAGEMPPDTALAVFPELCVTGYTCGDLFLQPLLLREAEQAVVRILDASLSVDALLVVGVPVPCGASLYNCAAVCQHGKLLGLVPKSHIPSYSEYYEGRHFTPADDTCRDIFYAGQDTILSRSLLFVCRNIPDFRVGVEVCEDLWVADQPSSRLASAGATVIANLSASDESVGKGRIPPSDRDDPVGPPVLRVCVCRRGRGGIDGRSRIFRAEYDRGKRRNPCGERAVHHRATLYRGRSGPSGVRAAAP